MSTPQLPAGTRVVSLVAIGLVNPLARLTPGTIVGDWPDGSYVVQFDGVATRMLVRPCFVRPLTDHERQYEYRLTLPPATRDQLGD